MEHQAVSPDRVDAEEEEFPDEFMCCVCLDIMYRPVVLACGHISCFWCTFQAMGFPESHCPVCRNTYNHFPRSCELLHFLLLKLYPSAYKRRAAQVAEVEEKKYGCESPQLESNDVLSKSSEVDHAQDATSKGDEQTIQDVSHNTSIQLSSSPEAPLNDTNAMETSSAKVLVTDLECAVCKQLLYRPIVLNCGHVYCESCIQPNESVYKCPVCQSAHPKGIPSVCLFLHHFLGEYFPKEYSARKECLSHCQSEAPCGSSTEEKKQTAKSTSPPTWRSIGANIHYQAGCDHCGMYPIIGQRYRCKDCVEKIGFDLCENCHKSSSKLPGRFNQQHTEEHQFELIPSPIRLGVSSHIILLDEDEETDSENDGVALVPNGG